eukprot:snap_masked-scaffold_14-processed-gene-1.21-mRNA-1 protein AED:1.00 eAED:1.00 QI:0/0/0/0/1/1/2/0/317
MYNNKQNEINLLWTGKGFLDFIPTFQQHLTSSLGPNFILEQAVWNNDELEETKLSNCDVLIPSGHKINSTLLNKMPNLKLIFLPAAGTEIVDQDAVSKRGIPLIYCPGMNAESTAEFSVLLILSALRKFNSLLERGFSGKALGKCSIGLIGCGKIGSHVQKILEKGFGASVIVLDSKHKRKDLVKMLKECDVVSLHLPLKKTTKRLIGEEELKLMKKDSILVNTSRAQIVDEDALLKCLHQKNYGPGIFATDVFWREPLQELDANLKKFRNLDSFLLTPHAASNTEDVQTIMAEALVNAVQQVIVNKDLSGLTNRLV